MTSASFSAGLRLAIPVVLGYLPVGFAFGVMAVKAGMTPLTVGLMAYFVYAGSAQLITANLLAGGAGVFAIVLTTLIVNLRHLLMSAAVIPYLRRWSKAEQAWFAFEMTDETFALNLGRFVGSGVDKGEAFGINTLAHFGWVGGCLLGALFDEAIGDVKPLGLDFALPGMFIALVLPHLRVPRKAAAVFFGGSLSLAFALCGAGQWNVISATALGAALAAFLPSAPAREREKA